MKILPEGAGRGVFRLALFLAIAAGCPALLAAQSAILLANNNFQSAHVTGGGNDLNIPGSTTFYQVDIPPGTQVLEVRLEIQSGDADLYLGSSMSFDPSDYPFDSAQGGLSTERARLDEFSDPSLSSQSTWYVVVHGYDPTDYYLLVSWGSADAAKPIENGKPISGHVRA